LLTNENVLIDYYDSSDEAQGELRWGDVALGQNAANFFPLNLIGLLGSLTSSFGNFNQNA
jgi:hypothetical protein